MAGNPHANESSKGAHMKSLVFCVVCLVVAGCTEIIKANMMLIHDESLLKQCDYVNTFKMHFDSDGTPQPKSPFANSNSANGFASAVAHGANAIIRRETAPAPLVRVDSYRCPLSLMSQH
jgi:hypothetical protein